MAAQDQASEEKAPQRQLGFFKNFVAGGSGGVCLVLVGHPFDTVKVRMQTQPRPGPGEAPMFRNSLHCVQKTVKQEGLRGLYRGMLAPLMGIMPVFAISFAGYAFGQRIQKKSDSDKLTVLQHFNAGVISAVFTTPIMAPGERIKCLMQVQRESKGQAKYSSSIDCAKQLYRSGGITSIYRGVVSTLVRDMPASGLYFGVYEWLLRVMTPQGQSRHQLSPLKILFAGGMGGVANWVVAIVPDTLKSRYQSAPDGQYSGVRDVARQLLRTDGFKGMFKGIGPAMLRAFPANAAAFLGFETSLRILDWILPGW